jgi:hypothetical protein
VDFTLEETQQAVARLAAEVLDQGRPAAAPAAVPAARDADGYDSALWKELGQAGQLGEACIHGMNGVAEAVRGVRGTSVNQVCGDGPLLVTAGTGVPTSGLVLGPA